MKWKMYVAGTVIVGTLGCAVVAATSSTTGSTVPPATAQQGTSASSTGSKPVPSTPLTPAQQATKNALCVAFNSNAIAPTGVPLGMLEAGCPSVRV